MASVSYQYQLPQNTYTIDQYIACQSDTSVCYANLSFSDIDGNIKYATYNVLSDYIDEIRSEYCVTVQLTDEQFEKYKYRPKLLCFDIYGETELAFIILIINDMCSAKEFRKKKLLMPKKTNMALIKKYLLNANLSAIADYNKKNN